MVLTVEAIRVDRVLLHMKVHSDFDYFYSGGLTKGQETVGEYSKRAPGWDGLDGRLWFLANSHFKQARTTRTQGRKMTLRLKDRGTRDTDRKKKKDRGHTNHTRAEDIDLDRWSIRLTSMSRFSSWTGQPVTCGPRTCRYTVCPPSDAFLSIDICSGFICLLTHYAE